MVVVQLQQRQPVFSWLAVAVPRVFQLAKISVMSDRPSNRFRQFVVRRNKKKNNH